MEAAVWHEVVGYAASLAIVVSLSMRSILRLRLFGLAGSVLFLAYGSLIGAMPIVVTNAVIISIHLYFLRKLLGRNELFEILRVRPDSLYLLRFIEFHDAEIQRFQPGFRYLPTEETLPVFILRDMVPAGLLVAVPRSDDTLEIELDYATPQYRDFKLGRFVYSEESGIFGDAVCAWSEPWSEEHTAYLARMGFQESERDGRSVLERPLGARSDSSHPR
jgi:hypothetical protein